jgi:hypothetical protein
MATIRLYNDYGGAHYECNTPRSLRTILNQVTDYGFQFEIVRGSDLSWVQQCVKNWREDTLHYEEIA